jgi:hypothetical protein
MARVPSISADRRGRRATARAAGARAGRAIVVKETRGCRRVAAAVLRISEANVKTRLHRAGDARGS